MIKVIILFVLLLFCSGVSSVKHNLRYFLAGSYGVPEFPEFVATGLVDGVLLGYWDSNRKTATLTPEWVKDLLKDDSTHLEWYSHMYSEFTEFFRENFEGSVQLLNQSGDVHILQKMNGCDWDDKTEKMVGFNQYGYDGEDFIALDLQSLTWIAPNPLTSNPPKKWVVDKAVLERDKFFLTRHCPDWLKKYVSEGQSFLQRTELPSVSLLQKTSSSPITCHATGFYPNNAVLFWRKDAEELHKDREILPHPDGTFQMSVDLTLPSESSSDWGRYECVFQLSGVKEGMVTKLDKAAIRSNEVKRAGGGVVVIVVVIGLLLVLCIAALSIRRRISYDLLSENQPAGGATTPLQHEPSECITEKLPTGATVDHKI